MSVTRTAVVTGASSGIGEATARALAADGWTVVCAARRQDRVEAVAAEIGGTAAVLDVTDRGSVEAFAAALPDDVCLLVNNAGLALGQEPVAVADLDAWEQMYATNVIGTTRVTQALLPRLIKSKGKIVFITSTAADVPYEGGAGYCGAKAAERMVAGALRLELVDSPVTIHDVAPGMVRTPEFALNRYGGDRARADSVYAGVAEPLVADDVAEMVRWIASLPGHVDVDRLTVRPRAQARAAQGAPSPLVARRAEGAAMTVPIEPVHPVPGPPSGPEPVPTPDPGPEIDPPGDPQPIPDPGPIE